MSVEELETWFKNVDLPKGPFQLVPGTTINNLERFLEVQFQSLKNNPGSKANEPVLYRVKLLKLLLEANL